MSVKGGVYIIGLLALLGAVSGAKKECPEVKPMAKFDANAFTGRWFEIKRSKTPVDAFRGSCSSVNFTVNSKQNITMSFSTKVGGRMVNSKNFALMSSNGVLDWNFSIANMKFNFDYYVIGTDYTNYAVTFACGSVPVVGAVQMVWIYGRAKTLDQKYIDQALNDLKAQKIEAQTFADVDQKKCE